MYSQEGMREGCQGGVRMNDDVVIWLSMYRPECAKIKSGQFLGNKSLSASCIYHMFT